MPATQYLLPGEDYYNENSAGGEELIPGESYMQQAAPAPSFIPSWAISRNIINPHGQAS